jgi:aminoacrylate peracid reductase
MRSRVVCRDSIEPLLQPCSAAIVCGEVVYVSGIHAVDANGDIVGVGDVAAQTQFVLRNIIHILETAGGSYLDVVFNQIILSDMANYRAMNDAYKYFYPDEPPARSCIGAHLLRPEYLVEIASVAHIRKRNLSAVT